MRTPTNISRIPNRESEFGAEKSTPATIEDMTKVHNCPEMRNIIPIQNMILPMRFLILESVSDLGFVKSFMPILYTQEIR